MSRSSCSAATGRRCRHVHPRARRRTYVADLHNQEIKNILPGYDRTLLVADPRSCEPKKFGGGGARARFQKRLLNPKRLR
ncbi:hypothetical protein Ddye_001983 [Dipteronia dyeriana]|uniref:Uncharacterized protein n=1 Tax=Dipteronia dyeriana TaxID=168575 RepID=A0AAD9XPP2_9ROSI|nr:hypothetical protein Ddye_001983 [Dipteronia dyeriana]